MVIASAFNCALSSGGKEEVKKAIKIKREWKGYNCGYTEPSKLVIKTEEQWREVWGKVHRLQLPMPGLPKIDFEKEMVIAVFMGEQKSGGYEIEITSVTETEEEIVVEVVERKPPPESLRTMVLTQPFHIVVVEKSPLPVRFQQ